MMVQLVFRLVERIPALGKQRGNKKKICKPSKFNGEQTKDMNEEKTE